MAGSKAQPTGNVSPAPSSWSISTHQIVITFNIKIAKEAHILGQQCHGREKFEVQGGEVVVPTTTY